MKPTVGRIVHFHFDKGQGEEPPIAAIITVVEDGSTAVRLSLFNGEGSVIPRHSVPFSETPKPGHWNWPPRE